MEPEPNGTHYRLKPELPKNPPYLHPGCGGFFVPEPCWKSFVGRTWEQTPETPQALIFGGI
jgi:hypothetical protein